MRLTQAAALAAGFVALATVGRPQGQDFSKVEVKTEALAPGIWVLQGAGGNVGLSAGADGVFLIDDDFAPVTPKIKAAVAAVSDKPIRFVFNTHWHGDHTGGNEMLGESGSIIVAQDNVRTRMSAEQFVGMAKTKVPPSPEKALPLVTFNDSVTFHLNGDTIQAVHFPSAHTDGDAAVFFKKANVIHTGDLFFNGFYPFIDVGTGGSLEGMAAAADRLLTMADDKTKIIPGHGPVGDRAALRAYRDMLVGVRDAILPMVKAGKTLDEVKAAKPTANFDEKWGKGFMKPDDFVAIAYASLSRKAAR